MGGFTWLPASLMRLSLSLRKRMIWYKHRGDAMEPISAKIRNTPHCMYMRRNGDRHSITNVHG